MTKIIKIEGLDCANCAAKLEKKLKKIKEIDELSISFVAKKMKIEFNNIDFDDLIKKIIDVTNKFESGIVYNYE